MSKSGKELEVKFYLSDLPALQARLEGLGAVLVQPRTHEVNLRFDTPSLDLLHSNRLLRLRQDRAACITYKGPGSEQGGARLRQELEFTVGDFATAQAVLEALGYQVIMMYEKYRAVYRLPGPALESTGDAPLLVTLDEMPYGHFAEIEGPDGASIQGAAAQLGLDWSARILESYVVLFDHVRAGRGLSFRDLSFANFEGLSIAPETLGVRLADS